MGNCFKKQNKQEEQEDTFFNVTKLNNLTNYDKTKYKKELDKKYINNKKSINFIYGDTLYENN
tara:strand:+ start:605 stop:793 length:189 start_codon:yes stop_codon:yes gene_type:complete